MAAANEEEILEGFLCPICKADLKSASQLTSHFESLHQGEQDVLKSLKDIFGKAKKVILNADDSDLKEQFGGPSNSQDYYPYEEQTIGVSRSYTDHFKAIRSARLDRYAAETNKLLIRLNKLVCNMPIEPNQRKQHEQNVVPWLDGTSVNLCPNCAKSFTLTRRKHHCRLCGSIICHDCSVFLDLSIAQALGMPASQITQKFEQNEKNTLRMCEHCYKLIALRKQVQDNRISKSALVALYNQMRALMEQTKSAIVLHDKMRKNVCEGEGNYTLSDIVAQRERVAKMGEGIHVVSKKIMELPAEPNTKQAMLQEFIRLHAAQFVKEQLLELRRPPTEEQINEMKRKRYENAQKNIHMERASVQIERMRRIEEEEERRNRAQQQEHDENNPLLEQMNIVRGYIRVARRDLNFEELAILETNLKDLKKEYQLQKL